MLKWVGLLPPLLLAAMSVARAEPTTAPVVAAPAAWVRPTPLPADIKRLPIPVDQAKTPIAILRNDQQIRFTANGGENYLQSIVKLQDPQGLAAFGTITLPWNPDTQTLVIHALKIHRGAQVIDVLASQSFTVLRREANLERQALDGMLSATIQPEGLQIGDMIELALTVRTIDPVTKGHAEWSSGPIDGFSGTPRSLRLLWPKDSPLRWRSANGLPEPKIAVVGNEREATLAITTTDKPIAPDSAPDRYDPQRSFAVSDFADWAMLSARFAPLYEKAAVIGSASPIQAEIAKIKAATTDPARRASLALKLVQDRVRYVYLGLELGNLIPATADLTWSRRFGDCKGKTALLLAVLRALGVDAEPALVSTRNGDGLDQKLPSIAAFDHVLVRATIAGQTYWLDGTRIGDRSIETLAVPDLHWALPVRATGATLIALQPAQLQKPQIETLVELKASKGIFAPVHAEVTRRIRGDLGLGFRIQLGSMSPGDLDRELKAYWKKEIDYIEPEAAEARFDEDAGEEVLTMSGKAKLDWEGNGVEPEGSSLGWDSKLERKPGPFADAPVAISYPYWRTTKTIIELPSPGFVVKGTDIAETAGGYAFRRKSLLDKAYFEVESSTKSLQPELPLTEAKAAESKIAAIDKNHLYIHAPASYYPTSADIIALKSQTLTEARPLLKRGNLLLEQGDEVGALTDFEDALKIEPTNAQALADRAIIKIRRGDLAAAQIDVDAAQKIDPRHIVVHHVRAQLAEARGDYGAAIEALTLAITIWPKDGWALYQRSTLLADRGDAVRALADVDEIATIDPYFAPPKRVEILLALGRAGDAWAVMEAAIKERKIAPPDDAERAKLLILTNKLDDARAMIARIRAKAVAKKSAEGLNALCWVQATTKTDLSQALDDCNAALKIEPAAAAIIDSKAMVLLQLGRNAEAAALFSKALEIAPTQSMSLAGRGIAKLRLGDSSGEADLARARMRSGLIEINLKSAGVVRPGAVSETKPQPKPATPDQAKTAPQ